MSIEFEDNLVSVIIPVYNAEKYIEATLDSVLSQTYTHLEIIVIDDCSSDNSAAIVKKIAGNDNRVAYYRNENNSGAAVSRNNGLTLANGRYIAFLDSDDLWDAEKIEKQIKIIKKDKEKFVYCAYDLINSEGVQIKSKLPIKEKVKYKDLLRRTLISTPTVIYDRSSFGNLRFPLRRTGQDYAFWLLLLKQVDAYGVDEALVHVRKREGSLSKNKLQNIKDVWEVQTINEKINPFSAFLNVICYCFYTLKKRII